MYIVFTLTLILDQAVKYYLLNNFAVGEGFVLVPGFIEIVLQHNPGMAFSIFAAKPMMMKFLVTVLALALTFVAYRIPRHKTLLKLAFAFILAGAYSNLIDRYIFGYVIDFINFLFVDFAVFNIADVALNIGGILLFLTLCIKEDEAVNAN